MLSSMHFRCRAFMPGRRSRAAAESRWRLNYSATESTSTSRQNRSYITDGEKDWQINGCVVRQTEKPMERMMIGRRQGQTERWIDGEAEGERYRRCPNWKLLRDSNPTVEFAWGWNMTHPLQEQDSILSVDFYNSAVLAIYCTMHQLVMLLSKVAIYWSATDEINEKQLL